jgi:DNA-binding CsgD family transcriptional regulator
MISRARRLDRRAAATTVVVALQALAAMFFLVDLAGDVAAEGWGTHLAIEGLAAVALLIAVVMGALQIRALLAMARRDEAAVAVAKGALGDLIQLRFVQWQLTAAEADVALFALKGCDISEIAALRGAAAGTVRAQLARIYAKAGVTSHTALVATFIDELMDRSMPTAVPALPTESES